MPRYPTLLLAGCAIFSASGAANALTLTQSFYSSTGTSFSNTSPAVTIAGPFSASATVNQFDPTMGGLTSVSVETIVNGALTFTMTGTIGDAYTNIILSLPYAVRSSATGTPTTVSTGTAYLDNSPGNNNASSNGSQVANAPFVTGSGPGTGLTGTLARTGNNNVGSNTFGLDLFRTISTNLNAYTGSSTVSLSFLTGSIGSVNGQYPQNDQIGGFGSEAVALLVNYNYDAPTGVPEPASLTVLGVGLIAAGRLRRRAR